MKFLRYLLLSVVAVLWVDTAMSQVAQWRDVHKTKRKETLYSIARDYGITVDELIKANPEMASPDFVLKKGTFVCIPFPQMQAQPDTLMVKPEPPKPVKSDMRNREIRVGVMLPLHTINGDGRRMTEYYRGVLMACDSLRQMGISVDIHAWNVAEDMDINAFLTDEAAQMDLIIGPLYSKMVKPLSDFATKNDIRVLRAPRARAGSGSRRPPPPDSAAVPGDTGRSARVPIHEGAAPTAGRGGYHVLGDEPEYERGEVCSELQYGTA